MRLQNLLYLLCLGCMLYAPSATLAQQKAVYKGPLKISNYKGEVFYDYRIVNGDTIFDGSFGLQSANLEDLLEKEDSSFTISGNFKDNYPSGNWTFRFNEFQSNNSSSVEAYEYILKVDGKQRFASGLLKKGKAHGKWICALQQINNSEIIGTAFESTINFKNGVPQQSFTIQNKAQELVGRFLRNGVAHDEWTLYTDDALDATEVWRFNEGILERIQLKTKEDILTTDIYSGVIKNTKTIPLDANYLDILKIILPEENIQQILESGIIRLLGQNDAFYQNIDTILSELSGASFSPDFKVKVPYYPLDHTETSLLDSISSIYEQSRGISDILLENTELNILKIADQKVRSLEESVALVSSQILDPLGQLTRFYKKDMLSYFSREEFLYKIWPKNTEENTDIPAIEKAKSKAYNLANTKTLALESKRYLDSVQQILTKNISKQKREQEAIVLEKQLIAQVAYLEKLQDSLKVDSIPPVFANTIGNIKNNTANKLSTYTGMKNAKAKLAYARELVSCFEKLDQVGEAIARLPEQQHMIASKYQDAIWNPFTATIMDESVKKRLVTAYNTVLIPHFLKEIEGGLACEDTDQWMTLLNATYSRMLELRDKDTKKLERKLKKEKDPLVILQRLKIKPQIRSTK